MRRIELPGVRAAPSPIFDEMTVGAKVSYSRIAVAVRNEQTPVRRERHSCMLIEKRGAWGALLDHMGFPGQGFVFLAENHLQPSLLVQFDDEVRSRIHVPDIVLWIDENAVRSLVDIQTLADETHERPVWPELHQRMLASISYINIILRVQRNAHGFPEIDIIWQFQEFRIGSVRCRA